MLAYRSLIRITLLGLNDLIIAGSLFSGIHALTAKDQEKLLQGNLINLNYLKSTTPSDDN